MDVQDSPSEDLNAEARTLGRAGDNGARQ